MLALEFRRERAADRQRALDRGRRRPARRPFIRVHRADVVAHEERRMRAVRHRLARLPRSILLGEDARRREIGGELLDASDGPGLRRHGPTGRSSFDATVGEHSHASEPAGEPASGPVVAERARRELLSGRLGIGRRLNPRLAAGAQPGRQRHREGQRSDDDVTRSMRWHRREPNSRTPANRWRPAGRGADEEARDGPSPAVRARGSGQR